MRAKLEIFFTLRPALTSLTAASLGESSKLFSPPNLWITTSPLLAIFAADVAPTHAAVASHAAAVAPTAADVASLAAAVAPPANVAPLCC